MKKNIVREEIIEKLIHFMQNDNNFDLSVIPEHDLVQSYPNREKLLNFVDGLIPFVKSFSKNKEKKKIPKWNYFDKNIRVDIEHIRSTQFLVDCNGTYSVCTIDYNADEERFYFKDDNYLEITPHRFKIIS